MFEPNSSPMPPMVIAMSGLVASGKSTVASEIAKVLGARVLVADAVRDALLGVRPPERPGIAALTQNYAPDLPQKVYDELLRRTESLLAAGHTVIVDGCFGTRAERAALRELAAKFSAPFLFVECRTPEAVIFERLAERAARDGVTLRDWQEIYSRFKASWEEESELGAADHTVVDTSQPLSVTVTELCQAIARSVEHAPHA